MYGTVMVRAYQHHVVQRILAAAAQPVHVVRFAEIPSVQGLGVPSAKLAHAFVQPPQLVDMLSVAPPSLFEQIAAAPSRYTGCFGRDEIRYRIRIAEEDTGLQFLLRQQTGPRLARQVTGVFHKDLVVRRAQPPYGRVTLE